MTAISAARQAAFRILLEMERGDGQSGELLRRAAVDALSAADRNLTTTLVLGVLRWQTVLDAQFRTRLAKPNAKVDPEIRVALRLGIFQLLHLDRIPAHAAINESVELAKQAGHRFAAGMVNAVLRSVAAERAKQLALESTPVGAVPGFASENEAMRLRIESRAAYPGWMVNRWARRFGADAACDICVHGQHQPRLTVRLADADVGEELADEGVKLASGILLTNARMVAAGDLTATDAFRKGHVRIQDEGSQLVAEIAACTSKDAARVLDACAAPGGKTMILADRLPEARIVACEASGSRHSALQERLVQYTQRVECRLADAAALDEDGFFDLVLADVPCSGTGTLGRNPEIRHRLHEPDLARQAERQRAILQAALRAVKPGGRVVYSTCSLEPEENEQVVSSVAARVVPMGELFEAMRAERVLTQVGAADLAKCLRPEGFLRLLPGALGTDGFFVAVIERGS